MVPRYPLTSGDFVSLIVGPGVKRLTAGANKDEMSAHGFRAAASSILNESGSWNPDAIEAQLAHLETNAIRRAYARAEFWDERIRMMQWWADRLDEFKSTVV
jgi:integrase